MHRKVIKRLLWGTGGVILILGILVLTTGLPGATDSPEEPSIDSAEQAMDPETQDVNPEEQAESTPTKVEFHSPVDLQRPDALIVTQSLSQLPRDILSVPLLKELLTEDFVFYYEQNERSLSLRGTLRRIAYENEMNLGDELIAYILNAPVEIALWKSEDGKLSHYMLVMDRTWLIKALELISKVALSDDQLGVIGKLSLKDDEEISIYKLNYAYGRNLFFTGYKGHFFVFSDEGMLLSENEQDKLNTEALFKSAKPTGLFEQRFQLGNAPAKHSIIVSTGYLSFGYQTFFPSVHALKFDYSESGWSTSSLVAKAGEANSFDSALLWGAVPTSPALCFALPVEPASAEKILETLMPDDTAQTRQLLRAVHSPAAVCWYQQSKMYTPLLLIKMEDQAGMERSLRALFETTIHQIEATRASQEESPEPSPGQPQEANQPGEGEKVHPPASPGKISEKSGEEGTVWQREVSSIYGMVEGSHFKVTLACWKGYLIFSPDDTLVDHTIAVLNKKYPALSDSLKEGSNLSLILFPERFGELMKASALESLPGAEEPVFRESVSRHLFPLLDNIQKFPAYTLSMPAQPTGPQAVWESLKWEAFAVR